MSHLPLLVSLACLGSPARPPTPRLAPPLVEQVVQAGGLISAGKGAEALGVLGSSGQPEVRYLRALAQESVGALAEALESLEGLAERLPDVADHVHAARGRCLAGLDRHLLAAAAFAAVPSTSVRSADSMIRRSRALALAGRHAEALAGLEALQDQPAPPDPARPDPAATALLLAGELRTGATPPDVAGARSALLRCWAEHAIAPEAPACLVALRRLPGGAGADPDLASSARRAEGLVERNRSAEAIALLEPLARSGPGPAADQPLACRIHAALGRALRRDHQNARSAEVLRPVAETCSEAGVRTRARFVLATAASALGAREEAIELYRRFAREQPGSPLADDALVAAADLLARAGRGREATAALRELVRGHPEGDKFDEARFRLAWQARRDGDTTGAIAALQVIETDRSGVDAYEHGRAAYWRAVLISTQGPAGLLAARATWRALIEAAPADYYSLLSRARLGGRVAVELPEPGPDAADGEAPWSLDPGPLAQDPHYRAGRLLLRLGLTRAAEEELLAIDGSRLATGQGEPSAQLVLVAGLLSRAGNHREAHQLLRAEAKAALRRPPAGMGRTIWDLAYPLAYARYVVPCAASSEVPPMLVQALMREESALDPEAVSAAGAIGLTQLMLPTARQVARRLKLAEPDRAALTDPETSIRLGAAYLGQLLKRAGGSPAVALAAYNAGEGAVRRWNPPSASSGLDEWIENIPFEETRGYVKRVLRSYASYHLLGGGRPPWRVPAGEVMPPDLTADAPPVPE